jgi:hypothetical protein
LQNETRPEYLDMAAGMYEVSGYPLTGQALRNRAAVLRGYQPPYNVPMPDTTWPWPGYPQGQPAPTPPWPVPQYPAPTPSGNETEDDSQPPVWTYPNTPASNMQTEGNDSSLMPMLALVGAGLAFS